MASNFQRLKIKIGKFGQSKNNDTYKYSVYMQSRDSSWLDRNTNDEEDGDDEPEPLHEEDMRD